MRISDWSSDVCSSDLLAALDDAIDEIGVVHFLGRERPAREQHLLKLAQADRLDPGPHARPPADVAKRGMTEQRVVRRDQQRSEEHTSELQSLMRTSYAVFCLQKKNSRLHLSSIFQYH